MARRFDEAFRSIGITSGQFSLLISLNRPKPPTLGSVAELLAMDRTTLTANIKPLEKRGLLTVTPDPADRRARLLSLTQEGRAVLAEAVPLWHATQAAVEAAVPDPDAVRAGLDALA